MCKRCDLILIRHGEAEGNAAFIRSKFMGDSSGYTSELRSMSSSEWPLTTEGSARLSGVRDWLSEHAPLSALKLVTSPSKRAVDTATILLPDAAWEEEPLVGGRLWGGIECLPWEEWPAYCAAHDFAALPTSFHEAYPNGEAMEAVYGRVANFLDGVAQSVIAVTHGEVLLAARMHCEVIPPSEFPFLERDGLHIRNGHVVWYSRRNPETGVCGSRFSFRREYYDDTDTSWVELPAG